MPPIKWTSNVNHKTEVFILSFQSSLTHFYSFIRLWQQWPLLQAFSSGIFSICAPVVKISTDNARCVVPLQYQSFLYLSRSTLSRYNVLLYTFLLCKCGNVVKITRSLSQEARSTINPTCPPPDAVRQHPNINWALTSAHLTLHQLASFIFIGTECTAVIIGRNHGQLCRAAHAKANN